MSGVNLTGFTICFTLEKPVQFTPLVSRLNVRDTGNKYASYMRFFV